MRKRILVVSDLHLGGTPGSDSGVGFQMCSTEGQLRLVAFFDWATAQAQAQPQGIDLVIAGDIVDFLAEESDEVSNPLTLDQEQAVRKLDAIFARTPPVWSALGRFLATGAGLVLTIGNHDVELCLPRVRQRLFEKLGPGRIEFLYDNQALNYGPVLIEHGNRYDRWNAVFHEPLRRARSLLSRGLMAPVVPVQPGSKLVVDVINPIKRHLAFVDLLKPERAGVLPLLAFLCPVIWLHSGHAIREVLRAAVRQHDQAGEPLDPDRIANHAEMPFEDEKMFRAAFEFALGHDLDQVSANDTRARPPFWERNQRGINDLELKMLHRALVALVAP